MGDATQNWATRTIGETGKYINGLAFKPTDWGDEGMPIIRIQNLTSPTKPLNKTTRAVDPAYVVNPGDILVSWSATLDAFIWNREPALLNQHIFKVVPDTSVVTKKFLFYTLKKAIAEMIKSEHLHGSTMKHINRGPFLAHKIEVPTLKEQDEIVAELEKQFSRLDEAVANLERVKANLKRYKASVLKAAVEGRLVETEASLARREGRTYETGEQLLQRILDERRAGWTGKGKYKEPIAPVTDELQALPEGWTWATMPQLGELNRGKSKHRPRDDKALYGGPFPFIQTGDVRRSDGSITDFTQTYSEFGLTQSRLWPPGTLCITIAANIAETGILKLKACFPDSVVGFIPHLGSPTVEYVECFIRTARDGLDRFASATAQKNINLEVLEAVAIPTPPFAEQIRIVAEVDRHLSIIREVEAEVDANLQRAQALRQATLAKAFFRP
ncbi:restriction endonuclease subunit S [Rhodoferax sp.]|jgi:type I restriction enzyme S subunit|uniref:restriction endonuclease subunit S n=1 Tax=Rhodoferax sp. TaxID=50421 RepID=UPI00378531D6